MEARRRDPGIIRLKLYGYHREGDEWVIEPDEAEIVRYTFTGYLSGKLFREIAKKPDEKEAGSVRGTECFSPRTLRKIISNEEYMGSREKHRILVISLKAVNLV